MVKKCQTDSHLKRAQSCLSDIKSLGLLLVVLKQTLNWSLSARRNFECCTFSKKPIEKFVSFFNKLQNPTKVQAIQNLQNNQQRQRELGVHVPCIQETTQKIQAVCYPFFIVFRCSWIFFFSVFSKARVVLLYRQAQSQLIILFAGLMTINWETGNFLWAVWVVQGQIQMLLKCYQYWNVFSDLQLLH